MKKFVLVLFSVFALLVLVLGLVWVNRASVASSILSKNLGVGVRLSSLDFSHSKALIRGLLIKNPPHYREKAAFTARFISVTSSIDQLRANPLVIDEIVMNDLTIVVENSRNRDTSNWKEILKHNPHADSKRPYLIKRLVLRNLSVVSVAADGSVKRYPTLGYLEFKNLSDETGFPIGEIQKAIFNRVIQDVFKNFDDLQKMFNPIIPSPLPRATIPFFK